MTRTRLGLLGLCAMVFGLMAFASAAQAETGAKWLLAEKAPNSGLIAFLEAEVGLEKDSDGILHSEIAKTKVLFECKKIATVGGPKLKANGSIGVGKIKFSECVTELNNKVSPPCTPKDKVGGEGTIVTLDLDGLIVLHEKQELVSVLPSTAGSEVFAHIEMGEECSIGENVLVIGKATLKDCTDRTEAGACVSLALSHLVKHLVELGPLTELWTISKTAEHVATILGSSWAFLTGAHEGLKFSGDPA